MNAASPPPTPAGEPGRSRRLATIAIAAAVLLLPLAVLLVIYRGGQRRVVGEPGAVSGAAPPGDEEQEPPSIRETAEAGAPPFGGLKEPRDAALDRKGRLWVADFGNSRLRIFDGEGGFLGGWGGRGDGKYSFRDLTAVAIRGDDVYVADTWNGRVQRFDLAGEWKASAAGLFGPRGLAVAPDGKVWVSDTGNHRLAVYGADLGNAQFFGARGSGPGEFSSPVGIAIASTGSVYVADTGNRRIVLFDAAGAFQAGWAVPGWDRAVEPHLELDLDGSLWATDPGSAEVILHFDRSGKVVLRRETDDRGGHFSLPCGLALDRKARALYVVNSGTNTVSRLALAQGKAS